MVVSRDSVVGERIESGVALMPGDRWWRWRAGAQSSRYALMLVLVVAGAGVGACTENGSTGPATIELERVGGDGQRAAPGGVLPELLAVKMVDGRGRPVRGERVEWEATNGVVTPIEEVTNDNGLATARWKVGDRVGRDTAFAKSAKSEIVQFAAQVDESAKDGVIALDLETYDGSGQAVHPDHVWLPAGWKDAAQALLATPYPFGNASFENPSFYTGVDGDGWFVPAGLTNPIVRPSTGYLSDPDALYDPESGEILVYYRQVTSENRILLVRSSDGVHWGEPEPVASAPNHEIISPTVVRRGPTNWLMWSVNAGAAGCTSASTTIELRRSTDGVHWSTAEPVSLDQPEGFAWHLDVEWIPSRNEYWAVYPLKTAGDCTTRALYLATSPDGIQWKTYTSPLRSRGAIPEMMDVVYRSTIDYDATSDEVTLWYSGASYNGSAYVWHLARERLSLSAMLTRISSLTADRALPAPRGPALTNETAP